VSNNTLKDINLSDNSITNEGAIQISNFLKLNATLTSLDLGKVLNIIIGFNNIDTEGFKTIVDAMKENKGLTVLRLRNVDSTHSMQFN